MTTRAKYFAMKLADATLEKSSGGKMSVKGYFTSDNKDAVGDIITRKATENAVPAYREWGNIRYMHQPRPVGVVTAIGMDDGLEWNEVKFMVTKPDVIEDIDNGLLKALSVGILINWEDIDMLEDGGWVINAYSLAEISLVDHPANYDAKLKDMEGSEAVQYVARMYSGATHVTGENTTDKAVETPEEIMPKDEKVVDTAEEAITEELENVEPVVEETPEDTDADKAIDVEDAVIEEVDAEEVEKDAETEEEKAVDGEDNVQEDLEEEKGLPVDTVEDVIPADETIVEDVVEEMPEWMKSFTDAMTNFSTQLTDATEAMKALAPVLQEIDTEAESQVVDDEEEVAEEDKAMDAEVEAVAEPEKLAGALPATDVIEDEEELTKEPARGQRVLRDALEDMFKVN